MPQIHTAKQQTYHKILVSLFICFAVIIGSITSVLASKSVEAAPVEGFNAGNIISDVVFTNANSMNADGIQAFLNSKVPTCETWHAPAYGTNPPYICLKDYTEGGKSAAQIIFDTAQQYRINPAVLIVLLQKEQGLITDTWPLPSQYRSATGYGCPDTAACDSKYYGLTNQLQWAAKMFRSIMDGSPNWYTPYVLGNNFIRYSPDASCGGTNVVIQNRATQALYNYTPYQPNPGALAAGWGTAPCGAYGNRNFYLYFTSWFGSTQQTLPTSCSPSFISCIWRLTSPSGKTFYTSSIDERNTLVSSSGYSYNGIGLYGRATNVPGSVPVYRLIKNGTHFWTADNDERGRYVASGYTIEGIAWYTDPASANTGQAVYRLATSNGNRVYTSNTTERDQLISGGFANEGIVFQSPSTLIEVWASTTGYHNIYRLYNIATARHFWTNNLEERDSLIRSGYRYEGVGFEAQVSGSVPIYRLFNLSTGRHFWTKDAYERSVLLQQGFRDEGIGWMTNDSSSSSPIYRLYNIPLGRHFWTKDAYERSVLLQQGFRDEGIGWKAN